MKTLLLLRSICYMLHNIIVFCKLYFAYKSLSYLTIVEKVVEIIEKRHFGRLRNYLPTITTHRRKAQQIMQSFSSVSIIFLSSLYHNMI